MPHWHSFSTDSVSLHVENPTSSCLSEIAAALQREEHEVTRQTGWRKGEEMGEQ